MDDPLGDLIAVPTFRGRESLADGVYLVVRDAITSGTLSAGFRLREVALAKHFRVSNTPIREVLRRLEREGLVELSLHRGATVAKFRPEQWTDLNEVREILAVHGVRRAAEAQDRDFSRIEALLAESEAFLHDPDQIRFLQLDVAFHRALNDMGGNAELAEQAELLHRRIQGARVRYAVYLPGRPAISHAEHQAIVAAVRNRDAERAEALIRQHNATVRDAMIAILQGADIATSPPPDTS